MRSVLLNEQCTTIVISALYRASAKVVHDKYPEATPEEFHSYILQEFDSFTVNGQNFEYSFSNNVFGGMRYYFVCESCHHRAHKLFLPPETYKNYVHRYRCRFCHKLVNNSVVKGHDKVYLNVLRPLKRLRQIESRLEKGYLTKDLTTKLLDEYDEIDSKMKECVEYRLYSFKKKRGIRIIGDKK